MVVVVVVLGVVVVVLGVVVVVIVVAVAEVGAVVVAVVVLAVVVVEGEGEGAMARCEMAARLTSQRPPSYGPPPPTRPGWRVPWQYSRRGDRYEYGHIYSRIPVAQPHEYT